MTPDANTPVVIGASQFTIKEKNPEKFLDPLQMLVRIAKESAEDSGIGEKLIKNIDTVAVVNVAGWTPDNAPGLVAEALGVTATTELTTEVGGELALTLVNNVAERIKAGSSQVAFIAGSNNLAQATQAMKQQVPIEWPKGGNGAPERIGATTPGNSDLEKHYGINAPTNVYPMIENALRARRQRGIDEHQQKIGELMHRFTKIAASNPHAWFPIERSVEEITTANESNRMISFPYPKYMNAVLNTDQAAGIFIVSQAIADQLGVPQEKRVYWWGGANTYERSWFISERGAIGESPALMECAQRTYKNANVTLDDIQHIDFYSCFPVAVELGCEAYSIAEDDPRGLTITGGLPYAGGPGNNYPMHSLATMIQRLRQHPGDKGLVTGNGWYVTKHSATVWSTEPNPNTPTSAPGTEPTTGPEPLPVIEIANGDAVVDSYTVNYSRQGKPEQGIVLGHLVSNGERFIANVESDQRVLDDFVAQEGVGRSGKVTHREDRNIFTPA